jgi:NADH-quinone oxidoreductase subunit M
MVVSPLSVMLLAPLVGVALLLLLPKLSDAAVRRIAAIATAIPLGMALWVICTYDRTIGGFQFVQTIPWVQQLGISYSVAVNGVSIVLVLLHAICGYTGVLISYSITRRVKAYYCFYLTLIAGVFGVFVAHDLFFFYFFYEMAVIPMFPLIGIWGSDAPPYSQMYATMKLTLYLTAGAVIALVGLLSIYHLSGGHTFAMVELHEYLTLHPLPMSTQRWIFACLMVGFGAIAPMWPLHSWSPMGHAAAPSPVSMLHAGVLMKLGSYAIIRLGLMLVPEGAKFWLPIVATLCLCNIIYGGLVAMAQKDAKFIIGYSSSSHMGYVLLGLATLTPIGVSGAVLLMFAHGIMTALAFALIGHIYDQTHTRMIEQWGGLGQRLPFATVLFVMMAMASSGLPGFANFVSEVLVFIGAWEHYRLHVILAIAGIVITSTYMLRMVRTGFFGPLNPRWSDLQDLRTTFQRWPFLILVGTLLWVGCWPQPLISLIDHSVRPIVTHITDETAYAAYALPQHAGGHD